MGILSILSSSTTKQHLNNNNKLKHLNNNKLKLLVNHTPQGSPDPHFSLLSTEKEDDHKRETYSSNNPSFGFPFASCHELVLCLADYFDEKLALWNPSTKKVIKTLPQPPRPPASVEYYEYARFYGLGLDPKTDDDYKVIRNLEFEYEDPTFWSRSYDCLTELYSLKTDSWKHIACPHNNFVVVSSPIYIDGFNYWPVATNNNDFAIMSFDFAEECFPRALIPGPCADTYKDGPACAATYKLGPCAATGDYPYKFLLAEYEGSLAVVVYLVKDKLLELWAWKKKENDNQSWSRRGEWAIPNIAGVRKPLGLYKNDQFYFQDFTGELVLFDCAKQKLKNLGLYVDCTSMHIFPYYSE